MKKASTLSNFDRSSYQRIHQRMWLFLAIGLFLTCVFLGSYFSFLNYRSHSKQLENQLMSDLQLQAVALKSELFRFENLVLQITSRSRILQELEKYTLGMVDLESLKAFSEPKLRDAMRLANDMVGLKRLNAQGEEIIQVGEDFQRALWPVQFDSEKVQYGKPIELNNRQLMVLSAPVMNKNNIRLGTDLVAFDTARLKQVVDELQQGKQQSGQVRLVLLAADEIVFLTENKLFRDQAFEVWLTQEIKSRSLNNTFNAKLHRVEKSLVVGQTLVGQTDWQLIFIEEDRQFYAAALGSALNTWGSILLIALSGMVLTFIFIKPLAGKYTINASSLIKLLDERETLLAKVENNQAQLNSILDNTTSVVYVKDLDGKYVLINQRFSDLFHISKEDIIGLTDHEIFPAEIAAKFRENDLLVLEKKQAIELDEQAPAEDGLHDYLSIKFPLYDASNQVYAICGISTDITERMHQAEAVRVSEERFALAMQAANDGLWDWDLSTNAVYYSPRWKSMLGYAEDELADDFSTWEHLVDEVAKIETLKRINHCIDAQEEGFSIDFRMRHKDGYWVDILSRGTLIRDDEGIPKRFIGTHVDISERKRLENQLYESEIRANQIIDNAPDAIIMTDSSGVMIRVNPQAMSLFGYSEDELLGKKVELLVPDHLKSKHIKQRLQYYENPCIRQMQETEGRSVYGLMNNGAIFPAEASLSHVKVDNALHFIVTMRDISARIKAEKELKESNLRFQSLFEKSPDPSWIIDKHNFVDCNQAAISILGFTNKNELLNSHPSELSPARQPDGEDSYIKAERMMNIVLEKGTYRFEWVHKKADGSLFDAEVTLSSIQLLNETVLYCTWRDITDRKESEKELRAHRENLEELVRDRTVKLEEITRYHQRLFETSPIGLCLCRMDGGLEDMNPSFLNIIGYTKDECKALTYWDLTPGIYTEKEAQQLKTLEKNGRYGPYEKEFKHKSGNLVPVRLNGLLIEQNGHQYIWSSIEDITQSKQLQEQLAKAKDDAEKLAQVKSQFLANMSHEIRTPLNAVLGLSRMGRRESIFKSEELFEKITHSGEHLLNVVNDILDYSRIEAGMMQIEKTAFELVASIYNTTELVKKLAQDKGISLEVQISDGIPNWVIGDPLRLEQILINLLSNAVKFTNNGSVTLRVEDLKNGRTVFKVIDTGIGMSQSQMNRLFKPFEQADLSTTRRFGGAGLGLAISINLAKIMGGDINVNSGLGVGSEFILSLPLETTEPEIEIRIKSDSDREQRLKSMNFLAAEDVEINRLILADLLHQQGAHVLFAENGQEVVDIIKQRGEKHFHAILMDIQMPVMDGYEATKIINTMHPEIIIIGLTAHALGEEKSRCLASGMVDHITKPIDPEKLVSVILKHTQKANPALNTLVKSNSGHQAESSESDELGSLPGIDIEAGLNIVRGNKKLFIKLLKRFHEKQPFTIDSIQNNDQSTMDVVIQQAHALKGVSGNLGMKNIQTAADDLELACEQSDEHIEEYLIKLKKELRIVLDGLNNYFKR